MEEATLLDFNHHRNGQPKLVAIYPKEGTFYSDSPFIVLDAPWVTAEQREGAGVFQKFLAEKITPQAAARSGFRPTNPDQKPAPPITAEFGADPAQPTRELGLPEPRVLAKIKETWRADRKPANVLLVVDVSGSMAEENKLAQAKRGLASFLREVASQDRVGLTSFSTDITPLVPIAPIRENLQRLRQTVAGLTADGETTLYDATQAGVEAVRKINDSSRINAVVVLTDGVDTNSSLQADELVAELERRSEGDQRVRVFTIAYGAGASGSENVLEKIAAASGGKAYTGSVADIESVYRSISSFF
jgi:Ca-activated chloride channel family protein